MDGELEYPSDELNDTWVGKAITVFGREDKGTNLLGEPLNKRDESFWSGSVAYISRTPVRKTDSPNPHKFWVWIKFKGMEHEVRVAPGSTFITHQTVWPTGKGFL